MADPDCLRSGCQPGVPHGKANVKCKGRAIRFKSETSCRPVPLCVMTSLWFPPSVTIIETSLGQTFANFADETYEFEILPFLMMMMMMMVQMIILRLMLISITCRL